MSTIKGIGHLGGPPAPIQSTGASAQIGSSSQIQRVRTVDTFYDDLPVNEPRLFSHLTAVAAPPLGPGVIVPIAQYVVPSATVLDITGIEFFIQIPFGFAWVLAADDAVTGVMSFQTFRDEVALWDAAMMYPLLARQEGFDILNHNVLDFWADTSIHLIVTESARVRFQANFFGNAINLPVGTQIGVRVTGRWIPKQEWERVKG